METTASTHQLAPNKSCSLPPIPLCLFEIYFVLLNFTRPLPGDMKHIYSRPLSVHAPFFVLFYSCPSPFVVASTQCNQSPLPAVSLSFVLAFLDRQPKPLPSCSFPLILWLVSVGGPNSIYCRHFVLLRVPSTAAHNQQEPPPTPRPGYYFLPILHNKRQSHSSLPHQQTPLRPS